MAAQKNLEGAILGMGNPLLDISAEVPMSVLDKYDVKLNNAILAEEKHLPVYEELMKEHKVSLVGGGATQNSIRVAQWMLQDVAKDATTFIGCVGKDEYADKLREAAGHDGVKVHYMVDEAAATGTCACLIHKHERSLIANLSAANNYKIAHLETEQSQAEVAKAQIFYISGFFLTVSPDSIAKIGQHALDNGKTFIMNLAAPFISQFFTEPLTAALPFVDILIGNESEALAFAEKMEYEDKSLAGIAQRIAALPKKNDKPRVVIITHGDKATTVVVGDKTTEYAVPAVPEAEMVDVNGAGDAFVGGFLSQLVQGKSLEAGVHAGHYAAGVVIRTSGTSLSGKPDYEV